jgi:hypothetical protein
VCVSQIDLGSYTNRFAVSTRLPDCEPLRACRSRLDPLSIGERSTLDDGHVSCPNPLACGHEPPRNMEHLWSQAGATGGNWWQIGLSGKRLKQADSQPVATHRNGSGAHGKEGVNGSSPLEGSAKALQVGSFVFGSTCSPSIVQWVWSRLWSFRARQRLAELRAFGRLASTRSNVGVRPRRFLCSGVWHRSRLAMKRST